METEMMNGSSTTAMFDSLVKPAPPKQKQKQKKHKKRKQAQIQTAERRVLHHVSEAEGSSNRGSRWRQMINAALGSIVSIIF